MPTETGGQPARRFAAPAPPTDAEVLRRNAVERLKRERHPLEIRQQFGRLIAAGYEGVAEEDMVRLQWYGLYHDKPKVGTFMLRVKVPGGRLAPAQLRVIGGLSRRYGRDEGELTTRQNIQLHWLTLPDLPEVFATLDQAGLNLPGACGDTVRNITGCPVAGLTHDEPFDTSPFVEAAAAFFSGHPAYSDLPRKQKVTIAACPHQCNAPEINCIALVGTRNAAGEPGFGVRVGGGLSTAPRISRDLGVWIPADVAGMLEVLRAITDVWAEDTRYRISRAKARLKFAVDDLGADGYRERVEKRLGRRLPSFRCPAPVPGPQLHLGITAQRQPDRFVLGVPVFLGVCRGTQMEALADLAQACGAGIRLTRQQNLLLTDVPGARVDELRRRLAEIGFPLEGDGLRGAAVGCTGSPLCNYAVGETKSKLAQMVAQLETTFGAAVADLRLHLDGCPHACAQHFVGDIGLQGTSVRRGTEKIEAYDIFLGGGQGAEAAIGRALVRRVPTDVVTEYVGRLVGAYVRERRPGETYRAFFARKGDPALVAIAAGSPSAAEGMEEVPHHG